MPVFTDDVYYSLREQQSMESMGFSKIRVNRNWNITPKTENFSHLHRILNTDALARENFKDIDKNILMICRNHYRSLTKALQIFLYAIDWSDPEQLREVYKMLRAWSPLNPQDAIPLLDAFRADEQVRRYSVERISTLADDELNLYMLQLTQAIMFESRHLNPLSEMLLERALKNPLQIGQELFWQLKSQFHVKISFERNYLLLEQFMMLCGKFRDEIFEQVEYNQRLIGLAKKIKMQKGTPS